MLDCRFLQIDHFILVWKKKKKDMNADGILSVVSKRTSKTHPPLKSQAPTEFAIAL